MRSNIKTTLLLLAVGVSGTRTIRADYQITALPALPGSPQSFADAISPDGIIGGTSVSWDASNVYDVPTLWQNGQPFSLPLPPGCLAGVSAINSNVISIGTLQTQTGDLRPILWQNGQAQILDNLGLPDVVPYAINDAGVIVGYGTDLDKGIDEAITWTDGKASTLGNYTAAYGINNAGQILVIGERNGDAVWSLLTGATATPITPPTGTSMAARYLNDAGDVVGDIFHPDTQTNEAFFWRDGVFTVLSSLPGDTLEIANSVNASGVAVGSGGNSDGVGHALLWKDGQVIDLDSLIPSDLGWHGLSPLVISDDGTIIGTGSLNGQITGFELTQAAAPEPASLAVLAVGATALLRRRRR